MRQRSRSLSRVGASALQQPTAPPLPLPPRLRRPAGQTGAGKTHTMVGTGEEQGDSGLTGRALDAVFRAITRRVSEADHKRVFSTSVTCLEIYNEQARPRPRAPAPKPRKLSPFSRVPSPGANASRSRPHRGFFPGHNAPPLFDQVFDLLQPKGTKALHVRNNPQAGFYVDKLSSFPCDGAAAAGRHLKDGLRRRAVGSHRLNAGSSRSHCIFTLSVVSEPADVRTPAAATAAASTRQASSVPCKLCPHLRP